MGSTTDLVEYNYEALASITGGFGDDNFIGDTLFGKVFRGKIQQDGLETQDVVVKIWSIDMPDRTLAQRQRSRLDNEIKLLTNSDLKGHPNLVKIIGFCRETYRWGAVYELKPLDTVEKLILRDNCQVLELLARIEKRGSISEVFFLPRRKFVHGVHGAYPWATTLLALLVTCCMVTSRFVCLDDFKWLARIKVALEFACLLECFHDQQLLHRSIAAPHIMVDQAFSPRLFDFTILVGGGFGEIRSREIFGTPGYEDPFINMTGAWCDKTDVFSYGVVLLGLIAKRVFDLKNAQALGPLNFVYAWARSEYKEKPSKKPLSMLRGMFKKKHKESQSNKSLVDISFESDQYFDAGDGVEITKLAMRCVEEKPVQRPTMEEVVCCLRGLNVVKKFGHLLPKMSVGSSVGDILLQE